MGTFDRGLDKAFVQELNKQYDQDDGWRGFVDDSDLYLAIRGGYINIYYRGCSLLKWEAGHPGWKIHYKYLVRPNVKDPYVKVEGGRPTFLENERRYFIQDVRDRKALKKAVVPFAGLEKTGVHDVIHANDNILDVEVGLGKKDRVDLVALQGEGHRIALVFFEAKHFANPELRAKGQPRVVSQVRRYASMLRANRQAIAKSYRKVCENLVNLRGMPERHPERHAIMTRVVDRPQELYVDENPRLIVFGFDGDQKEGSYWQKHLQKLKNAIGENRVLLKGDSREFSSGISSRY